MKKLVQKFLKSFKAGEKGFTLIELLVVVAILGVLAAVAVPNVAKFMNSGNESAAKAELASVQTAVDGYMTEHNIVDATTFDIDDVAENIRGGAASLKGTYSWIADGTVTQTDDGY